MNKRIAVLLSGRGSNFAAIAAAVNAGRIPASIAVVVSNRASAPGLDHARSLGLETLVLPSQGVPRPDYDAALARALDQRSVDLVCLAGFMRLLGPEFVRPFAGRILNIHPSLLPAFPGLDAQKQAFEHGVRITGCTVHFVDEGLDSGPIVLQAAVPVMDTDTLETLTARILEAEHQAYPQAVSIVLSGKYHIDGRRVIRHKD